MAIPSAPREPDSLRRFDMRALWRLTGWGFGAALSLAVLAIVTQTDIGSRRLRLAFTPVELPVRPVAVVKVPPPVASEAELARVQAQLGALTADRDRLTERVASLEHSLDELTGSIKRQAEAARAPPAVPATPEPAPAAPPVIAAPAVTAPPAMAAPEKPPVEKKAEAEPVPQHEAAEPTAPEPAKPSVATPPRPAPAPAAATLRHVTVPMPPVRMAALPPKPEFGISLAGASSVALLHMQWAALRANFGALLGGLTPHVLRERRGTAMHYRLIVGPMPTYIVAAKLCARLIRAHAVCHPVKMAGEPL